MNRGTFITLEGLDGCGKTTQARLLGAWLQSRGMSACMTRQPGGTQIGDRLRSVLLDSHAGPVAPLTELALMFGDRAQSVLEIIEPALAANRVVVCDRFTDSTEAYQGAGRGLGSALVMEMHRLFCGDLQPDLTLYIRADLEVALARAHRRIERAKLAGKDEGRFEQEARSFYERVAAGYEAIAQREPSRMRVIEGSGNIEIVHQQICAVVQEFLQQC